MSLIHASAVIENGAVLGENVSVGPFAYIGAKVKIGDNTSVASHAVIEGDTTIGKNNFGILLTFSYLDRKFLFWILRNNVHFF